MPAQPNHNGFTAGGRVMAVTSMASSMERAIEKSLRNAEVIESEGKYYRKDIARISDPRPRPILNGDFRF
jgi:phosphoribosylamine-glycine ligase